MKSAVATTLTRSALTCLAAILTSATAVHAQFPAFPPRNVTSVQDRDQMMWQLGLSFSTLPPKLLDTNAPPNTHPSNASNPEGNWTDAAGHTITRSGHGLWNNYDDTSEGLFPGPESFLVGAYTPIDLLKMHDGAPITTPEQWWGMRRPEIFKDVCEQLWSVLPPDSVLPAVTWSVTTSTGGSGSSAYVEKIITGVLQPDNGAGLTSYLIGLCNKGNWRKPTDWGALGAWSWGVSKLIDYFETDANVDATQIGVTGHLRFGKAALVAMAHEPRLAIAFPSCGGSLGTKMNRRHWGQDLENSGWDQEYHWTAGNFFKWMGPLNAGSYLPRKIDLCPVDAHSLLALCAPRPVLLNGGTQNLWTDPYGIYLTGVGATPVYELLGKQGLVMSDAKPQVDVGYIGGK